MSDEIVYCAYCGSANKRSCVDCVECGKSIRSKARPFYDFLKFHIKDDLKGKVTDSVFSILKNFIISHLYGVVLSVTIVITTSVVVANSVLPSHIEAVDANEVSTSAPKESSGSIAENTAEDTKEADISALNDDEKYAIWHIVGNYDAMVDDNRNSTPYWADSEYWYYNSPSELLASNIPGFTRMGVCEMLSNPIDIGTATEQAGYRYINHRRDVSKESYRTGDGLRTTLAKELTGDGYRVAEADYVMSVYGGDDEATYENSAKEQLVYRFVMVEHQEKWYVAEERLIKRVGV